MTGYFFAGSKLGGLIIEQFSVTPSCALIVKNSTGDRRYSASSATLFSFIVASFVPSARYTSCRGGVFALEYMSTYVAAFGAKFTRCAPSSLVIRANPLPSSPTRYTCRSSGDFSVAVKYTTPFPSSTLSTWSTSQSPFVSCNGGFPEKSYK